MRTRVASVVAAVVAVIILVDAAVCGGGRSSNRTTDNLEQALVCRVYIAKALKGAQTLFGRGFGRQTVGVRALSDTPVGAAHGARGRQRRWRRQAESGAVGSYVTSTR